MILFWKFIIFCRWHETVHFTNIWFYNDMEVQYNVLPVQLYFEAILFIGILPQQAALFRAKIKHLTLDTTIFVGNLLECVKLWTEKYFTSSCGFKCRLCRCISRFSVFWGREYNVYDLHTFEPVIKGPKNMKKSKTTRIYCKDFNKLKYFNKNQGVCTFLIRGMK
jgi:hypothetical protein